MYLVRFLLKCLSFRETYGILKNEIVGFVLECSKKTLGSRGN